MITKKLIFVIAPLLFALTACATPSSPEAAANPTSSSSKATAVYATPKSCTDTTILATISPLIQDAKFIDTKWQPVAGTELADFLENHGIACSYGDARAAIGTTIKWVANATDLFTNRVSEWQSLNYQKVDLANVDESAAYFLYQPVGPKQEFQIWALNILINGTWIQINATYLTDLTGATSLISAALDSSLVK